VTKLRSSEHHADKILSTRGLVRPSSIASGGGGSTISVSGSTISVSSSTISATSVSPSTLTDDDIHRELDNFFYNLFSAFESFAQVVNLVYVVPPMNDDDATFFDVSTILVTRFAGETLTPYLTSISTQNWFREMKAFRKCTTHSKSIPFYFTYSRESTRESWEPKIILPDNPRSDSPDYPPNKEFGTFGMNILTEVFKAIENMFDILETRIRSADRIPVY